MHSKSSTSFLFPPFRTIGYSCLRPIIGARFHCAICVSVDICSNCESAGLPGNLTAEVEGGHDSSHIMIKVLPSHKLVGSRLILSRFRSLSNQPKSKS